MTDAQQKVQKAIEDLLRLATRHKIVVCGFAFGSEPPMITNFGNCADAHSPSLYERLTKMCEERRAAGQAEKITVGEVN